MLSRRNREQRTSETAPGEPRAGWERSAGSANPEFEGREARTTLYLRSARPVDGMGGLDGIGRRDGQETEQDFQTMNESRNSATSPATSRRSSGSHARPPRPGIGPAPRRSAK